MLRAVGMIELMTCNTSAVAVCCSKASRSRSEAAHSPL
jgi:hypothetical protein